MARECTIPVTSWAVVALRARPWLGRLGLGEFVGWLGGSPIRLTWHHELSQVLLPSYPLSPLIRFSFRISLNLELTEGYDNDDNTNGRTDLLATREAHDSNQTKGEERKPLEGRTGRRRFCRARFGPEPLREH